MHDHPDKAKPARDASVHPPVHPGTGLPSGAESVSGALFDRLYDEIRGIARELMSRERPGHTLQATALVNEAYLRLFERAEFHWKDRAHFLASVSLVMRRVLIDHARRHNARKRGGDLLRVTLHEDAHGRNPVDVLDLGRAMEKLAGLSPRQARAFELRYFAGLNREETARVLGVSEATVRNDTRFAKAWLRRELGA